MKIDVAEFARPCPCGHEHSIVVEDIFIESGAIQRLPGLIAGKGFLHPAVICDENTYRVAGEAVLELLPESGLVVLDPENLHANEHAVAMVEEKLQAVGTADVLLAVGSGTVHDATRFVAHKKGIPFISVPTAASVDGFVSTVAAMTWHGCKQTFPAVAPIFVVADSDIFAKAPVRLNASGVSDLLGKYTALADWKISHVVTGEFICDRVCQLEEEALKKVCACLPEIREGKKEACEELMYALLLSGIAMQMVGNSRPASGAEHHMSHTWEMEIINGHVDYYHGEKVSVGLVLSAGIYHKAACKLRKGEYSIKPHMDVEIDFLKEHVKNPDILAELIKENTPNPLDKVDSSVLAEKIPEILRIIDEIPSAEELVALIDQVGGVKSLSDIGLSDSMLGITARISPYVRNRLTFMRMLKLFEMEDLF